MIIDDMTRFLVIILILIIIIIFVLVYPDLDGPNQTLMTQQNGSGRTSIFSRFSYLPQYPFISQFSQDDPRLSKRYNTPERMKIIMGRPYRVYQMNLGNWGYPWTFPEPTDTRCLQLSQDRCNEEVVTLIKTPEQKLGGLGVVSPKEIVRPSRCFDSVYRQCRSGLDPLLIHAREQGVYD